MLLVINARSITRSAAAIVKGFMAFDPNVRIKGVILNNLTGSRHREKAVAAVEHYCGVPVVGTIPRTEEMELAMRHLGLVPYREGTEHDAFHQRIDLITEKIGEHVDLDLLGELVEDRAPPGEPDAFFAAPDPDIRIGVALDEAFNFYYSDLFDVLAALGAEVVPFSPIHGSLPEADGYVLGGGYPELFGPELEANASLREALSEESRRGTPIYAECGGLIYLTDRLVLKAGFQGSEQQQVYDMAGVFPGETRMPSRRMLGYVVGTSDAKSPLGAAAFKGHEFHYSDVRLEDGVRYSYRLSRGGGIEGGLDGATVDRTLGSYTHLHPVTSRGMFQHFVDQCRIRS